MQDSAFENDLPTYINYYHCPDCNTSWKRGWPSSRKDFCLCKAGKSHSPIKVELVPKVIELPCYGIKISLNERNVENTAYIGGIITSELYDEPEIGEVITVEQPIKTAINILESFILAAACSGINVSSPAFIETITTVADLIGNEYGE